MSLQGHLQDLATRVATELKTVHTRMGALSSLTTANKTNLVSAINEAGTPQTISLSGQDLSLSDGGGTVTLPAGGGGGEPVPQALNAQTGTTYTLTAADAGKVVTATNASPVTVTVPASTFATGQRVDVLQSGAGSVTLAAGAGMILHGTPSLVTRATWSAVSVLFLTAAEGVVIGDLATP